jgi:hypothetical protein
MNTYPKTSTLCKPKGADLIPVGTLGYFRARNRWQAYDLVLTEFKNSGLTKADLARRLGKRPEVVSRLLGAPGNWGLDTVSDLLFAICGAAVVYNATHPLELPARNDIQPERLGDYEWLVANQRHTQQLTQSQAADKQATAAGFSVTPRRKDERNTNTAMPVHPAPYSGLAVASP